ARVLQVVCAHQVTDYQVDSPKVLQVVWQAQPPLLLGLISKIAGTVLHTDMAEITGQLIANGRALVGPNHYVDPKKNPLCGAGAPGARFV
ncbi:MAG: hypothetical protein ABIU95_15635, partial [Burkholderiales bacterium]